MPLLASSLSSRRCCDSCRVRSRMGTTLLELLVALSVIALLLVILIPAVQQARETSRRTTCVANLRNISVALESYAAMRQRYPDGMAWREDLLPYLEQRPLYDAIGALDLSIAINRQQILPFLCPSDGYGDVSHTNANYFANYGTGLSAYGFNGFLAPRPGAPHAQAPWGVPYRSGPTRPQDVRDGLSRTAAFSEALVSEMSPNRVVDRRRAVWDLGDPLLVLPNRFDELRERCLAVDPPTADVLNVRGWRVLGRWDSVPNPPHRTIPLSPLSWGYDHALPPNSPPCGSVYGVLPPSSLHSRGVNVLFGDGHVEFVSDDVARKVWEALGSRATD